VNYSTCVIAQVHNLLLLSVIYASLRLANVSMLETVEYFFRTYSIVLISMTCSLLALYFMNEIRESSDVRFMPEISVDVCVACVPVSIF